MNIVIKALAFAAQKHRDQRRKNIEATPYINHPIDLLNILVNEAGVDDPLVLAAAVLHDTVEDTETTFAELEENFGHTICEIVREVTDDTALRKTERKQQQIDNAAYASHSARLVKLADKISNLRDLAVSMPVGWDQQRSREYFDWSKQVIDQLRGSQPKLESLFDQAYSNKP